MLNIRIRYIHPSGPRHTTGNARKKNESVELNLADTISLFLLVSLPWVFMMLNIRYEWRLDGFAPLVLIALIMLRTTVLFPRRTLTQDRLAPWKIGLLLLVLLALIAGIIWLRSNIDRVLLAFLAMLLIAAFWMRDIWLAGLRAKGQLPDNETLFPRRRISSERQDG